MKRVVAAGIFFLFAIGFPSAPLVAAEDFAAEGELGRLAAAADAPAGTTRLAERLKQALQRYREVRDYQALFVKMERSGERLGEEEKIYLKFQKPFKIFMKWLNTKKNGLQVFYERGRHDGKLAIHKPGLLFGLAPVVFLDQNSPWVREGSASYDIEDAGIGTFLEDFTRAFVEGSRQKKLQVAWPSEHTAEATFPGTQPSDEAYFAYRVVVGFDRSTQLPVRMELFDWENRATGIYEYRGVRLNTGDDEDFRKHINRYLLKAYLPAR